MFYFVRSGVLFCCWVAWLVEEQEEEPDYRLVALGFVPFCTLYTYLLHFLCTIRDSMIRKLADGRRGAVSVADELLHHVYRWSS